MKPFESVKGLSDQDVLNAYIFTIHKIKLVNRKELERPNINVDWTTQNNKYFDTLGGQNQREHGWMCDDQIVCISIKLI